MPTYLELSVMIKKKFAKLKTMEESKEYYELRNEIVDLMVLQLNMIDEKF